MTSSHARRALLRLQQGRRLLHVCHLGAHLLQPRAAPAHQIDQLMLLVLQRLQLQGHGVRLGLGLALELGRGAGMARGLHAC
jgi:hypothetical protein